MQEKHLETVIGLEVSSSVWQMSWYGQHMLLHRL